MSTHNDRVARLCEARAGNQADVPGAEDRNFHAVSA